MKQWLTAGLLVVTGLLLALALGEAGLWLLGIEYPDFFEYDPLLGSRLRPGVKGYYLKEGKGYVSINSDGLRDREHPLKPPPNTLRIAVLGDSFAEAMQVNREEAFWAVMEKDLQHCGRLGGRQVEVINFGQAGFGTAQELLAWRHRAAKYAPDLVLLAFFTGNDVADNAPALMQFPYNPYFSIQNGTLVLNDAQTRARWQQEQQGKSWGGNLNNGGRIISGFSSSCGKAAKPSKPGGQSRAAGARLRPRLRLPRVRKRASATASIARPPALSGRRPGKSPKRCCWRSKMRSPPGGLDYSWWCSATAPRFTPTQRSGRPLPKASGSLTCSTRIAAWKPSPKQHGIPILLLAPAFQEQATRQQVFFHGFKGNLGGGHWNQAGHRLAGTMLADWLCGQIN
jgi:hypothetical protein